LQFLTASRIVRDYDKYISRQLKRGTTRQELNVSWLKKGELEFKRTVTDLRDSIRQNWSTTGQELGRDIRQILQPSRPQSPAPGRSREHSQDHGALRSPTALSHLAHLDVPTSSPAANGSGSGQQQQRDFATGYALGLVGGVRNWVCLLFASGVILQGDGERLLTYVIADDEEQTQSQ
jgi:choline-phosphate cytidylyltransferase